MDQLNTDVAGSAGAGGTGPAPDQGGEATTSFSSPSPGSGPGQGQAPSLLESIEAGLAKLGDGSALPGQGAHPGQQVQPQDKAKQPGNQEKPEDLLKPPEGISPQATARFQQLVTTNKELTAKLEHTAQQHQKAEEVVTSIQKFFADHGLGQQDVAQYAQYHLFSQQAAQGNQQAAQAWGQALAQEIKRFELTTGQQIQINDPLGDHPDLLQAVRGNQMTEAAALEVARARTHMANSNTRSAQQKQQQEQQQAQQQAIQSATNDIKAFADQCANGDIDWAWKEAKIIAQVQEIVTQYPPNLWLDQVKRAYTLLSSLPSQGRQGGGPSPLVGSGGQANTPAPTTGEKASMMDVIGQGLGW